MRPAKIFQMGVGALLALVFIVTNFRVVLLTFAVAVSALVITGFALPNRGLFSFLLPAIHDENLSELTADIKAQPYPQLFVFRAETRNLFLLLISPLYSLGLAALVLARFDLKWAGTFEWEAFPGAFIKPFAGVLTSLAVLLAWTWAAERKLLLRGAMRLGIIHSQMGDGEWSYEYFDAAGERMGGTAFPWNRLTHHITPVFVDQRVGERRWNLDTCRLLNHAFERMASSKARSYFVGVRFAAPSTAFSAASGNWTGTKYSSG